MSNPIIPLAVAATGTGAQTRSAVQLPVSLAPVLPIVGFIRAALAGTSGALTATVTVETSQNDSGWSTAATITLGGTAGLAIGQSLGLTFSAPYVRANVTAISGTGAAVTVLLEMIPGPQ
jgi:galactitol-specific phosphotransferase system IIC component